MRTFVIATSVLFSTSLVLAATNPWFHEKSYAALNPDIVKSSLPKGLDSKLLREHYLKKGIKEGRFGRPYSNPLQFKEILEFEKISPALSAKRDSLDVQRDFKVGSTSVTALVRGPADLTNRPRKVFRLKDASESTEAYFESAWKLIRDEKLGVLTFPKQTLTVENSRDKSYQLIVRDLKDVGLDFSGSSIIFTDTSKRGLFITGDLQRVRFHNLSIDWKQGFVSPATVILNPDQSLSLKIEKPTGNLPILQFFTFYDISKRRWSALNEQDTWVNFSEPLVQSGEGGVYKVRELESLRPLFKSAKSLAGLARHHAPGKLSIVVSGDQVEDVQFTQLKIFNSAYMGIGVDRIKRGFLLSDSFVGPKPDSYISTASDAVHITSTQDIIIENNRFTGMGDDGLNIQSYTYKISKEISENTFEVESPHFRPQPNDRILVYSALMDFLGTASIVSAKATDSTLSKHVIVVKNAEGLASKIKIGTRIGLLRQHPTRFVLQNNEYSFNRSRALVIQGSLGLIQNNKIVAPTSSAILVATDADNWSEGMGATSLLFQGNTIQGANYFGLNRASRNLGAISVVSEVAAETPEFVGMQGKGMATYPLFQNIHFVGNSITDSKGAGIFVSAGRDITFSKNKIKATLLSPAKDSPSWGSSVGVSRLFPITLYRSFDVKSDDSSAALLYPTDVELSPTE